MKSNIVCCVIVIAASASLLFSVGCKSSGAPSGPAKIAGIVLIADLNGSANDGDSTTAANPVNHRYSAPASTSAKDGLSSASSDAPQFDHVSCGVHAIPSPKAIMPASAKSNNRLETEFDVSQEGSYSFILTMNLSGIKISGKGSIGVYVRANVLDTAGIVVDGGAVEFEDMRFSPDGTKLILGNDTTNMISVDSKGNLTKAFEGPVNPVKLKPGLYHLGIDLRIEAAAADASSKAEVATGSLAVALKNAAS